MIFDNVDISKLPANSEEAFATFEAKVREEYQKRASYDRELNADQNGNYEGSYEPERSYVTAILAFLDEYSLETQIEDISDLGNAEFIKRFGRFKSKIEYITTRYALRKNRISAGSIGTVLSIAQDYKAEIGSHLEKIRKIVNQEVSEGPKKDNIFKKIASLQSEVDRDLTTIDAAFGRVLDLSKVIGEAGGNLKPAVDQMERIKNIFWSKSEKVDRLPSPDRPKLIEKETGAYRTSIDDDEIPF